jgi:hypothetical protein
LLFVTFELGDLPLVGLFFLAMLAYPSSPAFAWREPEVFTLLAGAIVGRGARLLLQKGIGRSHTMTISRTCSEVDLKGTQLANFLYLFLGLLLFSSCWQFKISNYYHGARWMGLWDNPNIYGMLMSAGLVLAVGLVAADRKKMEDGGWRMAKTGCQKIVIGSSRRLLRMFLLVAAGMTGLGLVCSYSRGAWLGTTVGLLYLARAYGKFKWRWMLPGIIVVVAVVWFFWNATPDTAPWYMKRLDLGRPSAQHRVAAWYGALRMMRDHPFGVGWNNAVTVYEKCYSPPDGGAAAITTNDYLMLGTQLGVPGLVCFVAYLGLAFRRNHLHVAVKSGTSGGIPGELAGETPALRCACRAGALAMLVAFWFDGGLFELATAAVFWILLELGTSDTASVPNSIPQIESPVGTC